jgi:hypothetical protein
MISWWFIIEEVSHPLEFPPTNSAQSIKLRDAIKEYEANKWKVIGQKVGKPAKVGCTRIHMDSPLTVHSNPIFFLPHRLASNMPRNISRIFELLHLMTSSPGPH